MYGGKYILSCLILHRFSPTTIQFLFYVSKLLDNRLYLGCEGFVAIWTREGGYVKYLSVVIVSPPNHNIRLTQHSQD